MVRIPNQSYARFSANPFLMLWLAQRVPHFLQLLEKDPMNAAFFFHDNYYAALELGLDDYLVAVREKCLVPRRDTMKISNRP
jgi:hypothetical protein